MKFLDISDNVRETIISLVPSSILNEITCFVFYDDHPAQSKICDITICTTYGEVKEYYKREEVLSLSMASEIKFSRIRILRNSKCQIYYLLSTENELVIVSRKDTLAIHKTVNNMEYYDFNDSACRGEGCLKVILKDDAVPLIFDDNFENLGDRAVVLNAIHVDESLPILNQLKQKLTQAKYSINCNVKTQREFVDLRKLTSFAAYQKLHPNLDDSLFSEGYNEASELLKLKLKTPSVKICNQKVVITMNVISKNRKPLKDVAVLIHTKKPSIAYSTQLFQRTDSCPFWKEIYEIQSNQETAIVVVIDLTEIQYSRTSRIDFNGVISYKKEEKEFLMPFNNVVISYLEFMGKRFDVLANDIDCVSILSVLATTKRLDLTLRIITIISNEGHTLGQTLSDMFCKYLEMEQIIGVSNAVIHKKSPHHMLNGVMVVFDDENTHKTSMALHVRSNTQVLPLMHYIHEAIPHRIVVTSRNHKINAISHSLRMYNEKVPESVPVKLNYIGYANSMLRQTTMILEYLDGCIVKMNANKDAKIQNKIGTEIDLFAEGIGLYMDFRNNLLIEASKGIQCLKQV